MAVPGRILELIERFEGHSAAYRSGDYNEARLRQEFLNPFFAELGWDMDNRQGHAEPYKDVIHEDSLRIGQGTKAPDYCFRIGQTRKFFVEAKRPLVNIKSDIDPAYQLRRYAWTAKLPLSILTDFEEFAIYDCRNRPNVDDPAHVARTRYFTYHEYADAWDEIASIFSKQAILKGSFDKYAESNKGKRGTTEVDEAFLAEIEHWREVLAKNIATRNPSIGQEDLNFAVQRTIDRIVFLRICEDRGVEDYGRLQKISEEKDIYARLLERFHRADERYNSGLFHFRNEKDRNESHDELTPHLRIDDRPLQEILGNLYYPTSPYEFSVLSADILGHVYEQFLGKVIRLTPGHHAKIEEKPEVRKAGGVYYTPSYIVDYIVERTVGEALKDKSPFDAAQLRVLDPACGSGSFLLGAYQYLLDWHLRWFTEHEPEKLAKQKSPPLFVSKGGEWRLTAQKKKEVLLNNIFGVDIDSQAVEVTKLSLLLKVLEGETEETVAASLKLFHDRALPDLGRNIRHGNSLVSPDFLTHGQLRLALPESAGTSVFDWNKTFPHIFAAGGFDVVIGNPPYLSFAGRQSVEISEELRRYYSNTFESWAWPTAHSLFLERAIKTLSKRFIAFIVPDQVGHLEGYGPVRTVATRECGLREVRYWGEKVFKGVLTPALTVVLDKSLKQCSTTIYTKDNAATAGNISEGKEWNFSPAADLLKKLKENSFSLDKLVTDCGIRTTSAKDQVFPLSEVKGKYVPALEGKQINRFSCSPATIAVRTDSRKPVLFGKQENQQRAAFLIRQTAAYPIVGPHEYVPHFRNSLHGLAAPESGVDIKYLAGVLNSKLIRFVYTSTIRESQQKTFPQVKIAALRGLPIRNVDLKKASEKKLHDEIVRLVDLAIDLQKRITSEKNPVKRDSMAQQFTTIDSQLDLAIYRLYDLGQDDVAFVEHAIAAQEAEKGKDRKKSWRPQGKATKAIGGVRKAIASDEPVVVTSRKQKKAG